MVMHTQSGGDLEVMGLMQGKIKDGKFAFLLFIIKYFRYFLCDGFIRTARGRN